MEAARTPVPVPLRYQRIDSGRLLKLASDESLVGRVRAMLGSRDEAEDAVQQTFVSAYRDILRDDKEIKLRPWLYRIARNHCISTLRRRRPEAPLDGEQASVTGLAEEVSGRGELRALLADLARLPDDQREALVLAELHDNSHAEVAEILGCEREKVKSLVFQARSSLIKSREARDLSCEDVRLQLSSLKGSALRRGALGRHLSQCDGCRAFGADVRRQRQQIAVLLAVVPTAGLKLGASTALAAASTNTGIAGAGSATVAGSAPAAGAATGAGGGSLAALSAKVAAPGMLLKGIATTAAVTVLAVGGAVGVQRVSETVRGGAEQTQSADARDAAGVAGSRGVGGSAAGTKSSAAGSRSARRGAKRRHFGARGREHATAHRSRSQGLRRGAGRRDGAHRAEPRSKARNQLERRRERQNAVRRRRPDRAAPVRESPPATDAPSRDPAVRYPPVGADEPSGPTVP